jgi:hypothetical protein
MRYTAVEKIPYYHYYHCYGIFSTAVYLKANEGTAYINVVPHTHAVAKHHTEEVQGHDCMTACTLQMCRAG